MHAHLKTILLTVVVLGTLLFTAEPLSAHGHFHGGVIIGPAFHPWGWYSPFYYGAYGFYGPYEFYAPFGYYGYPNAGQVKLQTNVKDAQVFINSAYAGTAGKLKSMWLRPNSYDLVIRAPGHAQFAQRIYVLPGKTLHVHANLPVESKPQ
jgi:hypothetical protein